MKPKSQTKQITIIQNITIIFFYLQCSSSAREIENFKNLVVQGSVSDYINKITFNLSKLLRLISSPIRIIHKIQLLNLRYWCAKLKKIGSKISGSKFNLHTHLTTPVNMFYEDEEALNFQQSAMLKPTHFADLIRTAQLVFDPTSGVSGRYIEVDWQDFGIPDEVAQNLYLLGQKYRYASPGIPSDIIWEQLTPATRTWFVKHKDELWKFEEAFPPLDED